jgi:hypothetical protein
MDCIRTAHSQLFNICLESSYIQSELNVNPVVSEVWQGTLSERLTSGLF